jgi:hypothetical protein
MSAALFHLCVLSFTHFDCTYKLHLLKLNQIVDIFFDKQMVDIKSLEIDLIICFSLNALLTPKFYSCVILVIQVYIV